MDVRTLIASMLLGQIVLGIAMVIFWRTHRVYSGFGFWAAAVILSTVGLFLLNFGGLISDFVSVIISNLLLMASALFIFFGNRRFWGEPFNDYINTALVMLLVVALPAFLYIRNDINFRILISSFCVGTIYIRSAADLLFRVPQTFKSSSWYGGLVLALFSLLYGVRMVTVLLSPLPHDLVAPDPLQPLFFIFMILLCMAWIVSIFLLTGRRTELGFGSAQHELQRLASTDFLTGVYNRRAFFELGQGELSRARRYHRALTVMILDVDLFKRVNDLHGHPVGDAVLKALVFGCKSVLRDTDVLARMGGEEFAVLLPEANREEGYRVAEKLRRTIAGLAVPSESNSVQITVSVGIAMLAPDDQTIDAVMRRADAALYDAKRLGRDRVVSELVVKGPIGPAPFTEV